jgi:hypothetical protein
MPVFGTPTVVGTLSNSTSQTTYTVPITATTGLGDSIILIAGSSGGGTNNIPTSVTDSQGQTYQLIVPSNQGVGNLTYWQFFNSKVLTSSDTITVTYPVANAALKNCIAVDCPGIPASSQAIDQNAIVSVTGTTGTSPSASIIPATTYELLIVTEQNANAGGSPTVSSPLISLTTLHSGNAEYTNVSYAIVTSSVTASYTTGATGGWGIIAVGYFSSVPFYSLQQPFPVQFNPSFAFNPALSQVRPQAGQPPIPTVISSAPVNILGAQANIFTPGVNFLTGDNANFNGTSGTWTPGGNTSIAQTNAVSHNAQGALALTATTTGSVKASNSTAVKIFTNGLPVTGGDAVFGAAWVLAQATPRSVACGIDFYDSTGTIIGSTTFGPSITDSTTTWQLITATITAPSNAAWARVTPQTSGCVANEVHYVSDVWLFDITSGSGMGEQVVIYTPSQQQFQLSPNSIPYPLSLIGGLQFLPRQIQTAPFLTQQPGVPGTVSVVAGAGMPTIFQSFMPQFPWQQIMPGLQFIPSLNWVKQQISTANKPTYIDGGSGGQVTVNAQFSDMAVTISVSASPSNISVVAQVPSNIVSGTSANVNVVAPNGTAVVKVSATSSNINVQAPAGSLSITVSGAVANANVAAPSGIATSSAAGKPAQVNLSQPPDNIVIIAMGGVANVAVASTGSVAKSLPGPVSNVNATSPSGTINENMIGVAASVVVASVEGAQVSVTGPVVNITVAAPAGTTVISKTVTGATGTVAVASSGNVNISASASAGVIVIASAGSVIRSIAGPTANVSVSAPSPDFAGTISVTGTLVNPDVALDQLLSRQGRLLIIPVADSLISKTTPPQKQGI